MARIVIAFTQRPTTLFMIYFHWRNFRKKLQPSLGVTSPGSTGAELRCFGAICHKKIFPAINMALEALRSAKCSFSVRWRNFHSKLARLYFIQSPYDFIWPQVDHSSFLALGGEGEGWVRPTGRWMEKRKKEEGVVQPVDKANTCQVGTIFSALNQSGTYSSRRRKSYVMAGYTPGPSSTRLYFIRSRPDFILAKLIS